MLQVAVPRKKLTAPVPAAQAGEGQLSTPPRRARPESGAECNSDTVEQGPRASVRGPVSGRKQLPDVLTAVTGAAAMCAQLPWAVYFPACKQLRPQGERPAGKVGPPLGLGPPCDKAGGWEGGCLTELTLASSFPKDNVRSEEGGSTHSSGRARGAPLAQDGHTRSCRRSRHVKLTVASAFCLQRGLSAGPCPLAH